jgi:hypothetical protein
MANEERENLPSNVSTIMQHYANIARPTDYSLKTKLFKANYLPIIKAKMANTTQLDIKHFKV